MVTLATASILMVTIGARQSLGLSSRRDVWRLTLAAEGKSIPWRSGPPDDEITHTSEPDIGLWLPLELLFLGRLVPESLL